MLCQRKLKPRKYADGSSKITNLLTKEICLVIAQCLERKICHKTNLDECHENVCACNDVRCTRDVQLFTSLV